MTPSKTVASLGRKALFTPPQETVEIADDAALAAFCGRLRSAPFITVDTEFVRTRTYFPVGCLLQIASAAEVAIVDLSQNSLDLQPLWDLLVAPEVLKVFHAPSQDLEMLLARYGVFVAPLYDTQTAMGFLSPNESMSYGAMVESVLGTVLSKSHQISDWQRRPLREDQLAYARADVTYLWEVYRRIEERLRALGRTEWAAAAMAFLKDESAFRPHPETAYKKVKYQGVSGVHQSLLKRLCAWREERAILKDVPRRNVMGDETLLQIARIYPKNPADLALLRPAAAAFLQNGQTAEGLWAILQAPPQLPPPSPFKPLDPVYPQREALAQLIVRNQARILAIAPCHLCPAEWLRDFVRADPAGRAESPLMQGFRRTLIGTLLEEVLTGRKGIRLGDGADKDSIRLIDLPPEAEG